MIQGMQFFGRLRFGIVAVALITLGLGVGTAQAAVVFDGSPGSGAPPATLGGYTMTPFGPDSRPLGNLVAGVPDPAGPIAFSPSLNHRRVPAGGWSNWSNGYTGDVYWTVTGNTASVALPFGTVAFYLYAEGNEFTTVNITATTNSGTTSGAVAVTTPAGAKYFGFYGTAGSTLATITITSSSTDGDGFAIGEFGIARMLIGTPTSKSTPTLTTQAAGNVPFGGSVSDTATLSGGFGPTGSITFKLYGPNNTTCSGSPATTITVPVNGNGAYSSGGFTPTNTGVYRWVASYSGDTFNNAVTTVCGASNESVAVGPLPVLGGPPTT